MPAGRRPCSACPRALARTRDTCREVLEALSFPGDELLWRDVGEGGVRVVNEVADGYFLLVGVGVSTGEVADGFVHWEAEKRARWERQREGVVSGGGKEGKALLLVCARREGSLGVQVHFRFFKPSAICWRGGSPNKQTQNISHLGGDYFR